LLIERPVRPVAALTGYVPASRPASGSGPGCRPSQTPISSVRQTSSRQPQDDFPVAVGPSTEAVPACLSAGLPSTHRISGNAVPLYSRIKRKWTFGRRSLRVDRKVACIQAAPPARSGSTQPQQGRTAPGAAVGMRCRRNPVRENLRQFPRRSVTRSCSRLVQTLQAVILANAFDERIGSISFAIRAATAGSRVPVVERSWALIPPGTSRPKADDMIGQLIQWDRSPLIFFCAYLPSRSDMPPTRAVPA
jgi:hypothetical protein